MKNHRLKTETQYFDKVWMGNKTFEIRLNDREFVEGDTVTLVEGYTQTPMREFYPTGREISFRIGTVCDYKQLPGYVVFSLKERIENP